MLYIIVNDGREVKWSLGEPSPVLDQPIDRKLPRRFVSEISADGKELQHILNNFINIPKRKDAKLQSWHGDIARFVVGNIS